MHYNIHGPTETERDGPKRWTGTLRFEGKNHYFIRLAHISNWSNILLSLATRHERLQCALFATPPGSSPPNLLNQVSLGPRLNLDGDFAGFFQAFPQVPGHVLSRHSWVEIHGTKFHVGEAARIIDPGPLPCYLFIHLILTDGEIAYFGGQRRDSIGLSHEYCAFELGPPGPFAWISQRAFSTLQSLTLWRPNNAEGEFLSDRGN